MASWNHAVIMKNVKIDTQKPVDPAFKPDDRVDHSLRPRLLTELI